MRIEEHRFGRTQGGEDVAEFVLSTDKGLSVSLISWGASIRSVRMPDRRGESDEIALGFDTLERYMEKHPYFGATIGRYANRIAGAQFELDGKTWSLTCNEGRNQLHGGAKGFDRKNWTAEPFTTGGKIGVIFTVSSQDGDEGYPGNLNVTVTYTLTSENELSIDYAAVTDRATPVNLTNHSYWNLRGAGSGPVLDHLLTLRATRYLPIDADLIPTGEILPVAGTPMDFTREKPIGSDFEKTGGGYDHCFVLDRKDRAPAPAAEVWEPESGRGIRILTTQPGIQFYSGNFLSGIRGSGGKVFDLHGAFCLETENFPDAVHHPEFPDPILRPDERYEERTVHEFFLR